jgi:hypothetical protein
MRVMASTGCSGTPLAKKLSLKDGMSVWFDAMPDTDLGDVKVCAVDMVWSGLKLMIRKAAR